MDVELSEALARIEQRQAAYEVVAHRLIGILEVHNEKLDAILEAATIEPGPSPTTEVLKQILATMRRQTELLEALSDAISDTIRDEMQREDIEDEAEWELGQIPADDVDERGDAENKP